MNIQSILQEIEVAAKAAAIEKLIREHGLAKPEAIKAVRELDELK